MVNENIHGSVSHLQAEIKRLKDTIAQYQLQGNITEISKSPDEGRVNKPGEYLDMSQTHIN